MKLTWISLEVPVILVLGEEERFGRHRYPHGKRLTFLSISPSAY